MTTVRPHAVRFGAVFDPKCLNLVESENVDGCQLQRQLYGIVFTPHCRFLPVTSVAELDSGACGGGAAFQRHLECRGDRVSHFPIAFQPLAGIRLVRPSCHGKLCYQIVPHTAHVFLGLHLRANWFSYSCLELD